MVELMLLDRESFAYLSSNTHTHTLYSINKYYSYNIEYIIHRCLHFFDGFSLPPLLYIPTTIPFSVTPPPPVTYTYTHIFCLYILFTISFQVCCFSIHLSTLLSYVFAYFHTKLNLKYTYKVWDQWSLLTTYMFYFCYILCFLVASDLMLNSCLKKKVLYLLLFCSLLKLFILVLFFQIYFFY